MAPLARDRQNPPVRAGGLGDAIRFIERTGEWLHALNQETIAKSRTINGFVFSDEDDPRMPSAVHPVATLVESATLTSSTCLLGETFLHTSTTIPFGSMRKVSRWVPGTSFPKIFRDFQE